MKKYTKLLLSLLILPMMVLGLISGCTPKPQEKPDIEISIGKDIKNLIYIIGDGMGSNVISNTKTYYDKTFGFEQYYVTDITTYSRNAEVTDSAAAGTALATGQKADNGNISRKDNTNITHLMEIAQSKNKKTGIVTTDYLSGATPACFSAHTNSRNDKDNIIKCQYTSNIDLLIGKQDTQYYVDKYGKNFEENGYQIYTDYISMLSANKDKKLLASLNNLYSHYTPNTTNTIDYNILLNFVLDYMDYDNDNGFCLMIEEAYIDKNSHKNNLTGAMSAVMNIGEGIDHILDWCANRNDTAIIFTADHETGKLDKADSKETIENSLNSKGISSLYHKKSHTDRNVPLYLYNINLTINTPFKVDNTQVFEIANKVINNI